MRCRCKSLPDEIFAADRSIVKSAIAAEEISASYPSPYRSSFMHVSIISRAVSTRSSFIPIIFSSLLCTSVTTAPCLYASFAISIPVLPELLLVKIRIGSTCSAVGPPVTRTRLPASSLGESRCSAVRIISAIEAIFASPSWNLGPITVTPSRFNFSRFSIRTGLL